MKSFACKYCNDTFEFEKSSQCGGHITNCKENPNRELIREKQKLTQKQNNETKREIILTEYYLNPKLCEHCNNPIDYEKRNNRFCSSSCSATHNNLKRLCRSIESRNKTSQTLKYKLDNGLIITKSPTPESIQKRKSTFENKRIKFTCPVCFDELWLTEAEFRKKKFCSGTCRNKINNQFISGSCSKGELLLRETLKNEFPNLTIDHNNRKIIPGNKELDVYIPELNVAIEWNGVYHYKAIHSQEGLEKTQRNDFYKKEYCDQNGIRLIVIKDLNSSKKSNIENTNYVVNLIKREYSSIGRVSDSKPEG